jgi:TRAP-type C4-dicarboxylate transport system permease small subunit
MNHHPSEPEPTKDKRNVPRVPVKIEEFFAAMAMAGICCITMANVVVRYFTNVSFAFTEEFSVFLMVVLTLFGSAAAFARDRHIRMNFLVDRLPLGLARPIEYLMLALGALLFAVMAWYGTRLFWDDWQYDTTSPGIGIPQWIYTVWLPLLSAVIFLRILGRIVRFSRSKGRPGQDEVQP